MAEQVEQRATVPTAPGTVNRALWLYSLLVILTTACAWILYRSLNRSVYLRPLYSFYARFWDLQLYQFKIDHLSNGAAALAQGFPVFNYPAPAAYVYKVFLSGFPGHSIRAYLVFLAVCLMGFVFLAWRASKATGTVRYGAAAALITTALLGYPLWFTADRANIEGVVWALSGIGICLLLRAKYKSAAIMIGLAAVIKPFPALFFLLLLRQRKYKEVALGVGAGALVLIAALATLGPNPLQAYRDMQPGISSYMKKQGGTLGSPDEARFEHSLLDGMKSAALLVKTRGFHPRLAVETTNKLLAAPDVWRPLGTLLRIYPFILFLGIAAMIATFYRLPILNQLTAAGVAVTILPIVSADYTLLYLYVPFGAFLVFLVREVDAGRTQYAYRPMFMLAVLYALLFSPLTFLHIYAGDAKLFLLLALLWVAASSPMRSEYFDHPATTESSSEMSVT